MKVGCGKGQAQPPPTTVLQDANCTWPAIVSQPLLAQPEVTLACAGMMSMTVPKSIALKLPNNSIFFFFILNLFFLVRDRVFIKKASKGPVWPAPSDAAKGLASYKTGQLLKVGFGKGQVQLLFTSSQALKTGRFPPSVSQPRLEQPEVALAPAGVMSMTAPKSMALKLPNNNIFFFISRFSPFCPLGGP